MQIALKSLAVISIVVVVLISVGFFVLTQTGSSGTSASYDRIFFSKCEEIQQRGCGAGSEWNTIKGDTEFLLACQHLFGSEQEAFSCTYQFCSACKVYTTAEETTCGGWCSGITGMTLLKSVSVSAVCSRNPKCAATCSACRT